MSAQTSKRPKQAETLMAGEQTVSTYEATGGRVTAQFASHNFERLLPLPAGSIIHDNASGAGTVTRVILDRTPSDEQKKIHISATDKDQTFLDVLEKYVDQNGLDDIVSVGNMTAERLDISDEHFTHSITNIGIFFTTSAGLDGANEIYRTLKPGGTAVVNCWEHITWFKPILETHMAMRPGKPFGPPPVVNWSDGKQLKKIMIEAGFDEGKLSIEKSDAWARMKKSELRDWAEKTWAFLGGMGGWQESDEEKWDETIDLLVQKLLSADGTTIEGDEVSMRAGQWVVFATK